MKLYEALAAYGKAVMFGIGTPTPPATFNVPAGPPVLLGDNRPQAWQQSAWRYWKNVGVIHYPTTRLSRQTAQLGWRVRVNGRELTPDAAKREMEEVTAGMGPRDATYLLSLNLQVAGEAHYVEHKPDEFTVWSILEADLDKKLAALKSQGRIVRRIWQPDPTNTDAADSSVRTALGPAQELVTHEALSLSQARSRISQSGIIITPAEQLYAEQDPWESNLVEAMSTAIKDVDSPSAFAPLHIRMRRDLIEFVRYITFPRPYDDLIDRKQELAIRRIAQAIDIEPELVLGQGGATYWNAWAISMDTYQAHIAPKADQLGQLYAEVSEKLRERAGQTSVIEIEPDPRVMLARRSTVRDALDAVKIGAVGLAFVRDAIGATEADAPTEEDLAIIERLAGKSQDSDRERRVGENPGPARSSPENSRSVTTDLEAAEHARKVLGFKLRQAWRNTPNRNRLSGVEPSDYACWVPLSDISREVPVGEVVRDAVAEMCNPGDRERVSEWIMETLTQPLSSLKAKELLDA